MSSTGYASSGYSPTGYAPARAARLSNHTPTRPMRRVAERTPHRNSSASRRQSAPRAYQRRRVPVAPMPDNVLDLGELRRQRTLEAELAALHSLTATAPKALPRVESTPQVDAKQACAPCHWGLIVVTLLMALLSIPVVYSASQAIALDNHGNVDYFLIRQIGFVAIGLGLLIGASRLPIATMRAAAWVLYFVSLAGLLAIEFTPLGVTMGGVQRWLRLGPIPFQVSEIAKIALIGVLADFWSRAGRGAQRTAWPWVAAFAISAPVIGLVFKQPHLSATLVLFSIPIILGFYAGAPARQLVTLLVGLGVLGGLVMGLCAVKQMPLLPMYQQERIAHFFAKETDERGAHYQTEQGLRAMARGGLVGVGPGGSLFKQGHLPAPHTDFIFAIIGEETGLVGMLFY